MQARSIFLEDDVLDFFQMSGIVHKINILYINNHNRVGWLAVEEFKVRILNIFKVSSGDVALIPSVPQVDVVQ